MSEPSSSSPANWSALEVPAVAEVVTRAARKVSFKYAVDFDDLEQQGRIAVATTPDLLVCLDPDSGLSLGALRYRLERDLMNAAAREQRTRERLVSYDHRHDEHDDDVPRRPSTALAVRNDVDVYDQGLVELLLPAVWDDSHAWGMRVENAPDLDMPRGSANKSTGGTLAAHIADIRSAWRKCLLSLEQRQTLLMVFGLEWTHREAAPVLGVAKSTVSYRAEAGVRMLTGWLNGTAAAQSAATLPRAA